jgi:hypothetical protein
MQEEIDCLQDAIKALTKRKSCKRQYIRAEKTFTVGKVSNLITIKESSSCRDSKTPTKNMREESCCSYFSNIRHNPYTYKAKIENVDNSDAST